MKGVVRLAWPLLLGLFMIQAIAAQDGSGEPVYTSADLYKHCSGSGQSRQLCYAYIRGFSDGNRWLLRDEPVTVIDVSTPQAVCVPKAEPIGSAADLFVARFRGRTEELAKLSPFRALSIALSNRYPCK